MDDRQNDIALAHQDTCDWLFAKPEFQQWRDGTDLPSHNGVLWIKGIPGAGKSTLMKHTLLYCQENLTDHVHAAYFFNARGGILENSPLGMLRSLMYQLLKKNSLLCKRFILKFLDEQTKPEKVWQIGELKNFLLFEYKKHQPTPVLLLIDALDECTESEAREVISFLEDLSENAVRSQSALKICLSSRHYPRVSISKSLELILEKQNDHNEDIIKYVQHRLKVTDKEIEGEILDKAQHIFLWVVLVVEMLNKAFDDGQIEAIEKKLREVPSNLDEVFLNLLQKDNPNKQKTILMLQWVLFAVRLLRPEELYFGVLAGTDKEKLRAWDRSKVNNEVMQRFITSTSKGLVQVRKGRDGDTVQFIHKSVNDFLLRNKRLQKLDPTLEPNAVGASHNQLVACCMSYIMMKELEPLVKHMSYTRNELAFNYPFLEYASAYVLYHAEKAQAGRITQQALVQRLQQPHGEFERLRSFHDILEGKFWLIYGTGADLLYAVSLQGCYELIQIVLLEKGVNVNVRGGWFGSALQAASNQGHKAVVELLVEKGTQRR